MIVSVYRTLGITLHTVRADYDMCVVTFFTLPSIESNNSKCCPALPEEWVPAYAGTHGALAYIDYMIILFFRGRIWSGVFFRLGLSMRFSELEFSVKSFRSSAVFGGRLKRPSPCRMRSAPGRDRVCGLSETSEKCTKKRILGGIRPSYCWILAYAELEREKYIYGSKHLFPSWYHSNWIIISSPPHFFHGHTSRRLAYCRTTAVSLLFDIGFHGQIPFSSVVFEGRHCVPNDIIITPSQCPCWFFILERYNLLCGHRLWYRVNKVKQSQIIKVKAIEILAYRVRTQQNRPDHKNRK